jgi:hypothetical protein
MVLVACRAIEPEFEAAGGDENKPEIRYLDQGFHRTPQKMRAIIQEQVDKAAEYAGRIKEKINGHYRSVTKLNGSFSEAPFTFNEKLSNWVRFANRCFA